MMDTIPAMPRKPHNDLHGNVPDQAPLCLLIIDMINPFTFEGAQAMLPAAVAAAKRIMALKQRVKTAGLPVIYVNDNFGKWRSDFRKLVQHCLESSCRGRQIAHLLAPDNDDYFVLKPKHSGFYETPLDLLLQFLGAKRLILTGVAGNSCVLNTASDAYMREFEVATPADCIASLNPKDNRMALDLMRRALKADTRASGSLASGITKQGTNRTVLHRRRHHR
jgi:nicotinamidase-related amidase